MATAIKNIILDDIEARVDAIVDDSGVDLFVTASRGHPVQPAENQRPAAYVVGLDERPMAGPEEDWAINELPVGVVCFGRSTTDVDSELVDLENRVRKSLEMYEPSGSQFPINYRTTLSPLSNANIPQGAVMVVFTVRYATLRTNPYALS